MGLFSKSSSSSETRNISETTTTTAGSSEGSIAVAGGSSVNFVDPGAFEFGAKALDFARDVTSEAGRTSGEALAVYADKAKDDLAAAVQLSKSGTAQVTETITKYGAILVGVVALAAAAIFIFPRGKHGNS